MTDKHNASAVPIKCDGNHGGPRCADPDCWNDSLDDTRACAVPQGWKLVPVEPTPEMVRCAEMWDDGFEGAYARALASAPSQAPAQGPDEVFKALELDPESFRTEGGQVNAGKLKAAILHPYNYLSEDHWMQARFAKPGGRPPANLLGEGRAVVFGPGREIGEVFEPAPAVSDPADIDRQQLRDACARFVDGNRKSTAPAVPQGDPTEEMLVAGLKECEPLGELIDWREGFGRSEMRAVWEAMLAATPAPAQDVGLTDTAGLSMLIAGALFDFGGYLTTHPDVIDVGSTALAGPVADRIKVFAAMRGLSLDDAAVLSWSEAVAALRAKGSTL